MPWNSSVEFSLLIHDRQRRRFRLSVLARCLNHGTRIRTAPSCDASEVSYTGGAHGAHQIDAVVPRKRVENAHCDAGVHPVLMGDAPGYCQGRVPGKGLARALPVVAAAGIELGCKAGVAVNDQGVDDARYVLCA